MRNKKNAKTPLTTPLLEKVEEEKDDVKPEPAQEEKDQRDVESDPGEEIEKEVDDELTRLRKAHPSIMTLVVFGIPYMCVVFMFRSIMEMLLFDTASLWPEPFSSTIEGCLASVPGDDKNRKGTCTGAYTIHYVIFIATAHLFLAIFLWFAMWKFYTAIFGIDDRKADEKLRSSLTHVLIYGIAAIGMMSTLLAFVFAAIALLSLPCGTLDARATCKAGINKYVVRTMGWTAVGHSVFYLVAGYCVMRNPSMFDESVRKVLKGRKEESTSAPAEAFKDAPHELKRLVGAYPLAMTLVVCGIPIVFIILIFAGFIHANRIDQTTVWPEPFHSNMVKCIASVGADPDANRKFHCTRMYAVHLGKYIFVALSALHGVVWFTLWKVYTKLFQFEDAKAEKSLRSTVLATSGIAILLAYYMTAVFGCIFTLGSASQLPCGAGKNEPPCDYGMSPYVTQLIKWQGMELSIVVMITVYVFARIDTNDAVNKSA